MKRVYLKISEMTGHHGACDKCRLFGRLYIGEEGVQLCADCYIEAYEEPLEKETQKKNEYTKAKRLEEKFAETVIKRIEKGWCPVKIRH